MLVTPPRETTHMEGIDCPKNNNDDVLYCIPQAIQGKASRMSQNKGMATNTYEPTSRYQLFRAAAVIRK